MNKVEFQHNTGKHTLVGLTHEIPSHWKGDKVSIAGKEYEIEVVYDLPRHIAIVGNGDFLNQEVIFA